MRGLGLVGILVTIAILIVLWANSTSEVATVNKNVRPQVEQMAGVDETGRRVADSYTLKTLSNDGGKLRGMTVATMSPDSPMRSFYGLKEGDTIVEVSQRGGVMTKANEMDPELMRAFIAEAYQFKQPMVVERAGKRITLNPVDKSKPGPKENGSDLPAELKDLTKGR
jgi:hypothetical protein